MIFSGPVGKECSIVRGGNDEDAVLTGFGMKMSINSGLGAEWKLYTRYLLASQSTWKEELASLCFEIDAKSQELDDKEPKQMYERGQLKESDSKDYQTLNK